ncbi:MAG: UvrD-helicase domain-containing protein [Methylotenera sp.]
MYKDFGDSLKYLYSKGGPFRNAADKVLAIKAKADLKYPVKDVFSVATTHHGESRIPHCTKYDLPARARLVTVRNNDLCLFLFAGSHDAVDEWLDKNKGIDFIAKEQGGSIVIEPVFISANIPGVDVIKTGNDLGVTYLVELLSGRHKDKLFDGLNVQLIDEISNIDPLVSDDGLLELVDEIENEKQKDAIFDVLLKLREGDSTGAKNRIGLYIGDVKNIADLTSKETAEIKSGEQVIKLSDIDPQLFEHFVKTADYQKWMLYLHPSQREYVDRDFQSTVRLSGVSGSGKTCVLIHRALRLAEKYPSERILLLTLNPALANLIESLVAHNRGEMRPKNLVVSSFWELCREKIVSLEPHNKNLYTQETIATNPHAVSEHIEDIWDDYYESRNNNHDAKVMFPLHKSLLVRGIFPKDYLKQEFDYLRSAFAHSDRNKYLEMERSGRSVPLDRTYRSQVLNGLDGWEKIMPFVGALDSTGIAPALHKHIDKITPEYRAILVDEVQDFGTVELAIIRKLVKEDENDLFLCGDAAQSVYTKYHDFDAANINIKGARSMRLQQNYRNSRQILTAAHNVLTNNFELRSKGCVSLEILNPEYANFSSPKPLLLKADSLKQELGYSVAYAKSCLDGGINRKVCIAISGYTPRGIQEIGRYFNLPVLSGEMKINAGNIFFSDLEQTKGFEFDTMILVNICSGTLPHPDLPPEESFRDLCKFYVAMTRAKLELIISYHLQLTEFIPENSNDFISARWDSGYSEYLDDQNWILPKSSMSEKQYGIEWELTGRDFLLLPEAIGLPLNAQEKIDELVTGKISFEGKSRKQKSWKSLGEFLNDMISPINRQRVYLSDEAWLAIASQFKKPTGPVKPSTSEKRSIIGLTGLRENETNRDI